MKKILIIALIALVTVSTANAAGKHLFILSGQSNMSRLKPEVSFGPTVEKEFGKSNVVIAKSSVSAQAIGRWDKEWKGPMVRDKGAPGDLYDKLMGVVKKTVGSTSYKSFSSVTFIWMQGEADGVAKKGDVYGDSFKRVLEQLRKDLGRDDLNFVIGRLSPHGNKKPDWMTIRKFQKEFPEKSPRGDWVDTDKMARDGVHYTDPGYKVLGEQFALKAIGLIKK